MRRGLTALIGTVAGTALLVGAKLGQAPGGLAASGDSAVAAAAPTADSASVAAPSATARASVRPQATPKAASSTKPAPRTSATPKPGGLHDGKFAGPGVSEPYGIITVSVVVSGGRITDVSASCSCPTSRSVSISQTAFTTLEPRVLTAQTANVQSVSGATYTSAAYKQSLAAAINSAKA